MNEVKQNKILVAPLNWGLGHASRCVVIIRFLIENNFRPVIASDGDSLVFLCKEFPELEFLELPSYRIKYAKKGVFLKWKLLFSFFSIRAATKNECQMVQKELNSKEYAGIISDNRFGVYHDEIPSVYITHQLNVLSGFSTRFSSWVHQSVISNFKECWVPDLEEPKSLSGKLSLSPKKQNFSIKYIGGLSRLQRKEVAKKFDLLVLLSGPEPQRTLLENKLLDELINYKGKVAFVRGVLQPKGFLSSTENIKVFDYLLSKEIEEVLNQSELVIARSGYSTIMDLSKLQKKAFFIPTPGQTEQEYLAELMKNKNVAPYSTQKDFKISLLEEVKNYEGFLKISNNFILDEKILEIFKK
jgi:uncharacterized protein (TIGR00661 family)